MTQAQKIARQFGNDGMNWTDENGMSLSDVLEEEARYQETNEDGATRCVFVDGSAIVESGGCWDIEGIVPFSWSGSETWEQVAGYAPLRRLVEGWMKERGDLLTEQAITDCICDASDRLEDLMAASTDDPGAIVRLRGWMGLPALA